MQHKEEQLRLNISNIYKVYYVGLNLSSTVVSREGLIRGGIISALAGLLDDPVDICRRNTHQTFDMLAKLPQGRGF